MHRIEPAAEAQPQRDEPAGILALAEALSRALTASDVGDVVFGHVLPMVGAATGTLLLSTGQDDALELVGSVGSSQATADAFRRVPLDASTPAAEVLRTGQPLWIESLAHCVSQFPLFPARATGHQAFAVLPLAMADGVTSALVLAFAEERVFTPHERSFLIAIAAQCAIALQRAAAFDRERTSRERLEVALEAANMGTWDWDLHTDRITWSPQLEAIHGFEPGAFGSTLDVYFAQVHPDDVDRVRQGLAASLESGELNLEYRAVWPDGSLHWFEARGRLVRDATGQATALHGICTDVSARKQAEQALRESEERFRTLADHIAQLAWMADARGWIFWYNRRWYEYTGTTLEEMQGWGWTQVHHPDHVDRVVARIQHSWDTGEPWEDTFPLRGHNGEYRWFLSRAMPIGDERGRIVRWFGTNTDITEQREAEQERERLLRGAQAARELAEGAGRRLALQYELAELLAEAAPDATPPVLPAVCRALGWDWGALWRLDSDAGVLRCAELCQSAPGALDTFEAASRDLRFEPGEGLVGRVWRGGEPIWISELAREPGFTRIAAARHVGLQSAVALPLRVGREFVGVLEFLGREARLADPEMLATLVGIGGQLGQFLERRRADETLRRQAALLELAPAAVTVRDLASRITYWNRAAEELYGWTADEARGHVSHDVLGTRFPVSIADHEARLAKEGFWQGELIRRHRSGATIVVASRWALLRDQHGQPEATLEISTDITAQKRAEEELARLYAAEQSARADAEAARQRFQDLVHGLDAIVWEADATTFQFTFISQRAEDILGYPVERWLTEPHFWADHIVPDDREWAVNYCVSCTNKLEDHQFEYRLQAADGRVVWMRDIVHVVTDAHGQPALLRGVMVDITERRQAEAERARLYESERAARAEAEAAITARDEFVAVVSHDLRNPLTAVKGQIQMVRRRAARGEIPTAEQLVDRLNTIEASVMALSAQIDELHDATRLQAGRPLDLVLRPTDLVELARDCVVRHQQMSETHRLHFETTVPTLMCTGDAGRLERVLANLLSNAIKYTPQGGDITVQVVRDGNWGVVGVEDHGLGIPAADLPHVFERFRRASNVAGQIAGSGLGLAGARDIVGQHGGTISVQSVEGQGTTFVVRLPLSDEVQSD